MSVLELTLAGVFMASAACFFPAYFLYLPFYALMLKKYAPEKYEYLGGTIIFFPVHLVGVLLFFTQKKYLETNNNILICNGKILTWIFGYAGFLALISFCALLVYHFLKHM